MNKAQACTFLGCTEKALYNWVQGGVLPRRKVGRAYDWSEEELLAAAATRGWQRRVPEVPTAVPMSQPAGVAELIAMVRDLTLRVDELQMDLRTARNRERIRFDALSEDAHKLRGKLEWHIAEQGRALDVLPERVTKLESRVERHGTWIAGFYATDEDMLEQFRQQFRQRQHQITQQEHTLTRTARQNA
jgi:hypothetical protein